MTKLEIKGSIYQNRIDELNEALKHLNTVKELIFANYSWKPAKTDEFYDFLKPLLEAESSCSATILDLSTAIGELVILELATAHM